MASVNRLLLIGNLGADPEVKYLPSGNKLTKFSMATTSSYKGKDGNWVEETQWHNIVFFGDRFESAEKAVKGNQVIVGGKVTYRSWDKDDGTKGYMTEIVGDFFRNNSPKPTDDYVEQQPNEAEQDSGVDDEGDLPF